eukprot:6208307-Pleurochrysis_carterae.AAC.2
MVRAPRTTHVRGLLTAPSEESLSRSTDPEACAVIVGAARGIGLAAANLLVNGGRWKGHVFCLCRSPAEAHSLADLSASGRCSVVQACCITRP